MSSVSCSPLPDRGIVAISGPDSRTFLQGLISNDIERVSAEQAIYAALLTPQGKYLFDFFIVQVGETLLIECEKSRIGEFIKRLRIYKLRADADLTDASEVYGVYALWGDGAAETAGLAPAPGSARSVAGGAIFTDPRLGGAGVRAIIQTGEAEAQLAGFGVAAGTPADYDAHRLALGLPDASRDLIVDKSILLESGFDELNGVDWNKGCYMGQELTARTKYRGLIKKRLVPVTIVGEPPQAGAQILADGKNAGEMRSCNANHGLALMRLEYIDDASAELQCDQAVLHPSKPDWASF